MKAEEAVKLYYTSMKSVVREDVVYGMLEEAHKKIEKCSKKCIRKVTYHFGWVLWPFSRYFPNDLEKAFLIQKLKDDGYEVDYEFLGNWSQNTNIITIEW